MPATARRKNTTATHRKALAHLRSVDPRFGAVIDSVGACRYAARDEGTHFGALVRSIVYQQLSGKAAGTIHGRLCALYGDRDPTPAEILATPAETLRSVGLSRQKMSYLLDLSARVERGELPLDGVHELDDDALTAALVQVKGIGRWTAQMFMMFRLGRADVLPDLDLGIGSPSRLAAGQRSKTAILLNVDHPIRPQPTSHDNANSPRSIPCFRPRCFHRLCGGELQSVVGFL